MLPYAALNKSSGSSLFAEIFMDLRVKSIAILFIIYNGNMF